MKMAEVIHLNYQLLPIISRFGIDLGFGDKTIEQVCRESALNVDFFLEIVNSYHNKDYFPQKHLQGFSLKLITEYLQKSHEYYLHNKIPQIEELLHRFSESDQGSHLKVFQLIDQFFNEYRKELIDHIRHEEEKVYPYVLMIETAFQAKSSTPALVNRIRDYSIDHFEHEHNNVEDKLFDLKNILIKYLPFPFDTQLCHAILIELFRLESDLNDHTRIEDKVLVPRVKYMEKWILEHFTA
jgi:regulator of cell morphogenesis and NO signaling